MFCSECGKKLKEDCKFCPNCGHLRENGRKEKAEENIGVENNQQYSNGFAIGGFVLSLISLFNFGIFSLISLILSILGLNDSKKHDGVGKGISIAGIVISVISLLFLAFIIFVFAVIIMGANNVSSSFGGLSI